MISSAKRIGTGLLLDDLLSSRGDRGKPGYVMTHVDLLEFAACPARWVRGSPPEPQDPPDPLDVVLAGWLAPETGVRKLALPPDSFTAHINECPSCGSKSPSATCRKCGSRRRIVTKVVPWAPQAEFCRKWREEALAGGKKVVTPAVKDTAVRVIASLARTPAAEALEDASEHLVGYTARWKPADGAAVVPLATTVHLMPDGNSLLGRGLAELLLVETAAPAAAATRLLARGAQVRAALNLALVSEAEHDPRADYYWLLAERDEPCIIGRRQATRPLLEAGHKRLDQILEAYVKCLSTDTWPDFDPCLGEVHQHWAPLELEPWLTQTDAKTDAYFALSAAPAA